MDGAAPHPAPRAPGGKELSEGAPKKKEFTDVYAGEVRYVWRALWRLGVPERDLEDVAHDVFVVVHRKLNDYDPSRPIRPWLFGICFRVALDRRRKAATTREQLGHAADVADDDARSADTGGALGAELASHQVEQHQAGTARRAIVAQGLAALPLEQRAIFVLVELEGVAVTAAGDLLGVPYNTLSSRLRLARAAFARAVQRAWPESDMP